VPRIA